MKLSNSRTIQTDLLMVKENLISWKDTIIPLSSVSMIYTGNVIFRWSGIMIFFSVITALCGFITLATNQMYFQEIQSFLTALFLLFISGIGFTATILIKEYYKKMKRLVFLLDSGTEFSIVFKDKAFVDSVLSVFTKILSEPEQKSYVKINIKDNKFSNNSLDDNSSLLNINL